MFLGVDVVHLFVHMDGIQAKASAKSLLKDTEKMINQFLGGLP